MNKKLIAWMMPMLVVPVAALAFTDTINAAIGYIDFVGFYENFHTLIDTILYIIFFGTLCKKLLAQRLGKKASASIGIILGLALAVWFNNIGISLVSFGPLAAIVFLTILGVLLYQIFKAIMDGQHSIISGWTAFVIVFPLLLATVPQVEEWMKANQWSNMVYGILMLLWTIGLLFLVVYYLMKLFGQFGGGQGSGGGNQGNQGGNQNNNNNNQGNNQQNNQQNQPQPPPQDLLDEITHLEQAVRAYQGPVDELRQIAQMAHNHLPGNANAPQRINNYINWNNTHHLDQLARQINTIIASIGGHPRIADLQTADRRRFQNASHNFAQQEMRKQSYINALLRGQNPP